MSFNNKNFIISFVRHAESCGNAGIYYENEYQKDDPPLSPQGLLQAEKLAQSSYTDNITKIYSSTLLRTIQTAYPTAVKRTKEIILLPDLMEIGTEISGTELWRLKNDYQLAVPCISEPTPCGGKLLLGDENDDEKIARGRRCTDYFYNEAHDGDHFMVVSHGSYFGYLIRAALNIALPESFCWQVDNCSITRIIFRKDNIPKLSFANSISHLI